jgi:hypothetical protein
VKLPALRVKLVASALESELPSALGRYRIATPIESHSESASRA